MTFTENMNTTTTPETNNQSDNQLTNRCNAVECRKKLKLTDMECRCTKRFCTMHRLPESHACTFDHTAREWSALVNQLMSYQTTTKKVPTI